jgi:1-pyrroline-4-hydroxy-2-carboxylate deaminase
MDFLKPTPYLYEIKKAHMKINWKGVFSAVTTKFNPGFELDLETFGRNLDAQLSAGVSGIILGGTLGESSVLSADEKNELLKFTLSHVNGTVPVVMNIAEGSTREAVRVAEASEKAGVSGFMMLPPMRYKSDHRETVEYYKAVARATSKQIMVYNNPVDYKTEVTLDMFADLAACVNIDAVKESTRDTANVTRMLNRFGDRFSILTGVDTLALESLLMGAHGWVAGLVCAFPRETVAIYRKGQEGKIEEALALNRWFMPLLELDIHSKLVQYIKLAEEEAGIGTETVRPPRLPLIGEEREQVLRIIRSAIKNRPDLSENRSAKKPAFAL